MARVYHLFRQQRIPHSVEETFAFFSDAMNLEAITPGFLQFKILTPSPIHLQPGTLIDYRLKLLGVPFYWQTRIDTFEPNVRFSDTQLRGPYRRWYHRHEFAPIEGGTLMTDHVEYELPLGPLGALAHAVFVRSSLDQIFDYRRQRIEELLGAATQEPAAAHALR